MLRRFTRGKDASPAKQTNQTPPKKEQKSQDAEGFLCPMCMARLPGPAELQSHFEKAHSDGGVVGNANASFSDAQQQEKPNQTEEKLINLDDDDATDLGQKSKLQFSATEAGDSHEEVTFLQQELAELTTAIKEEKWYSGQLKDELDKVSAERDKLEEEREEFQQQYDSKLRSAEDSFLQVAQENEKLKDELRYADVKSLKERHSKLNSVIESLKMDLSQEKEMRSAVEEANRHMMEQIEKKDKFIDELNFQLKSRPTNDNVGSLENEIKSLKTQIQTLEKEKVMNSELETGKWKQNVEELKEEMSKQKLKVKELEIEKTAKVEQIDTVQNALNVAVEASKQAQQQAQDKQQQIIDLQHEAREAQAAVKEKSAFIIHFEKQLEDCKMSIDNEIKEKQSLQQKIRNLENSIDSGTRDSSEKEIKIKELENLIAKEKSEIQRLENERSDLVAKIEAGEGVETAINQLRQEKEKLIEGVANLEREMTEQSKRYSTELSDMRTEKAELKDEIEGLKNEKLGLEKKLKTNADELVVKEQSIEQLKSNLREKADDLHKQESERSAEKVLFEKEITDLKNFLQGRNNENSSLEQKISKVSADLENAKAAKSEVEELLKKEKETNESLNLNLIKVNDELSKKAETAANIQDELAKEKTDRSKEKESFQSQIAELVKEGDEKDKSIKELNDNIASKDGEIIAFRKQVDEYSRKLEIMDTEFASLRENEAALKKTIHNLEDEFGNQKEALNLQMEALIAKGEETETNFNNEIANKQKEIESLQIRMEDEVKQLHAKHAEKESQFEEKLKEKDGELYFISESSKEAVAGYQKSVSMLEEALKKEEEKFDNLENEIVKLNEDKSAIAASLELKDATLHEIQRKLEVAEAELKKKCESCKNYEIQLCRFQETHKEHISIVSNLEGEIGNLREEIKTSAEKYNALEEEFTTYKNDSKSTEQSLSGDLEQSKEVNAVLNARVLELDDELKEAYNKYDNMKSELSTLSTKLINHEEQEKQLTEQKTSLEKEISDLKLAEEELKTQIIKEKESANSRTDDILKQKSDVENELKEAENLIGKEKEKTEQAKEAIIKIQNVTKEKIQAIENKLGNIEREKEDMKKAHEENEARLNNEIRSLKENLMSSRKEIEDGKIRIKAINDKILNIEKEKDNLRGDVAVLEVQIQNINDEKRALTERVLQSEDAHKRTKERMSDTNRRLEQSLAALQELGQENQSIQMQQNFKLSRQWQDDSLVTNCKSCEKLFSLTVRKHHCRHCGDIFCNECANNYTQVAASKKAVRVCAPCYTELNSIRGRRMSAASMT